MGFERSLYGEVGLPFGTGGPGDAWADRGGRGPLAAREETKYQLHRSTWHILDQDDKSPSPEWLTFWTGTLLLRVARHHVVLGRPESLGHF